MKVGLWGVVLAGIVPAFLTVPAAADDGILSEIKGGIMAHDVPLLATQREDGADVNLEALFRSPDFLSVIGSPRPHVGAEINLAGDTSQIYTGLTWQWHPFDNGFWGAFSAGGSVNNGKVHAVSEDRKALGSHILFRLGLELGYDISERWNVSVLWDHVSNADLADENEGLNNLGVRVGFKF